MSEVTASQPEPEINGEQSTQAGGSTEAKVESTDGKQESAAEEVSAPTTTSGEAVNDNIAAVTEAATKEPEAEVREGAAPVNTTGEAAVPKDDIEKSTSAAEPIASTSTSTEAAAAAETATATAVAEVPQSGDPQVDTQPEDVKKSESDKANAEAQASNDGKKDAATKKSKDKKKVVIVEEIEEEDDDDDEDDDTEDYDQNDEPEASDSQQQIDSTVVEEISEQAYTKFHVQLMQQLQNDYDILRRSADEVLAKGTVTRKVLNIKTCTDLANVEQMMQPHFTEARQGEKKVLYSDEILKPIPSNATVNPKETGKKKYVLVISEKNLYIVKTKDKNTTVKRVPLKDIEYVLTSPFSLEGDFIALLAPSRAKDLLFQFRKADKKGETNSKGDLLKHLEDVFPVATKRELQHIIVEDILVHTRVTENERFKDAPIAVDPKDLEPFDLSNDFQRCNTNQKVRDIIMKYGEKRVYFSDIRDRKGEKRLTVITERSLYDIAFNDYKLMRRIALKEIECCCYHPTDLMLTALIVPSEYDIIIRSLKRRELIQSLLSVSNGRIKAIEDEALRNRVKLKKTVEYKRKMKAMNNHNSIINEIRLGIKRQDIAIIRTALEKARNAGMRTNRVYNLGVNEIKKIQRKHELEQLLEAAVTEKAFADLLKLIPEAESLMMYSTVRAITPKCIALMQEVVLSKKMDDAIKSNNQQRITAAFQEAISANILSQVQKYRMEYDHILQINNTNALMQELIERMDVEPHESDGDHLRLLIEHAERLGNANAELLLSARNKLPDYRKEAQMRRELITTIEERNERKITALIESYTALYQATNSIWIQKLIDYGEDALQGLSEFEASKRDVERLDFRIQRLETLCSMVTLSDAHKTELRQLKSTLPQSIKNLLPIVRIDKHHHKRYSDTLLKLERMHESDLAQELVKNFEEALNEKTLNEELLQELVDRAAPFMAFPEVEKRVHIANERLNYSSQMRKLAARMTEQAIEAAVGPIERMDDKKQYLNDLIDSSKPFVELSSARGRAEEILENVTVAEEAEIQLEAAMRTEDPIKIREAINYAQTLKDTKFFAQLQTKIQSAVDRCKILERDSLYLAQLNDAVQLSDTDLLKQLLSRKKPHLYRRYKQLHKQADAKLKELLERERILKELAETIKMKSSAKLAEFINTYQQLLPDLERRKAKNEYERLVALEKRMKELQIELRLVLAQPTEAKLTKIIESTEREFNEDDLASEVRVLLQASRSLLKRIEEQRQQTLNDDFLHPIDDQTADEEQDDEAKGAEAEFDNESPDTTEAIPIQQDTKQTSANGESKATHTNTALNPQDLLQSMQRRLKSLRDANTTPDYALVDDETKANQNRSDAIKDHSVHSTTVGAAVNGEVSVSIASTFVEKIRSHLWKATNDSEDNDSNKLDPLLTAPKKLPTASLEKLRESIRNLFTSQTGSSLVVDIHNPHIHHVITAIALLLSEHSKITADRGSRYVLWNVFKNFKQPTIQTAILDFECREVIHKLDAETFAEHASLLFVQYLLDNNYLVYFVSELLSNAAYLKICYTSASIFTSEYKKTQFLSLISLLEKFEYRLGFEKAAGYADLSKPVSKEDIESQVNPLSRIKGAVRAIIAYFATPGINMRDLGDEEKMPQIGVLVRKKLVPALVSLLLNGFIHTTTYFKFFSTKQHYWDIFEATAEATKRSATDISGATMSTMVSTVTEALSKSTVSRTEDELKAEKFTASVCHLLNNQILSEPLQNVVHNNTLLDQFYLPSAMLRSEDTQMRLRYFLSKLDSLPFRLKLAL